MSTSSPSRRYATRASLAKATELPPYDGPKLHRFEHSDSPIRWINRIDGIVGDEIDLSACVFKVEILHKEYTIKVFKPFDSTVIRWRYETMLQRKISSQSALYLLDPFFAECRAYGKLKDKQCRNSASRAMIAQCHGFLFLTQNDEDALEGFKVDFETNNLGRKNIPRRPLAAIVKDLIEPAQELQKAHVVKILRGICALQDYEIFNRDIRTENFVNGQLVDFGASMTRPHKILDNLPSGYRDSIICSALVRFDDMIEQNDIDFQLQTYPELTDVVDGSGKFLETCDRMLARMQSSRVTRSSKSKKV